MHVHAVEACRRHCVHLWWRKHDSVDRRQMCFSSSWAWVVKLFASATIHKMRCVNPGLRHQTNQQTMCRMLKRLHCPRILMDTNLFSGVYVVLHWVCPSVLPGQTCRNKGAGCFILHSHHAAWSSLSAQYMSKMKFEKSLFVRTQSGFDWEPVFSKVSPCCLCAMKRRESEKLNHTGAQKITVQPFWWPKSCVRWFSIRRSLRLNSQNLTETVSRIHFSKEADTMFNNATLPQWKKLMTIISQHHDNEVRKCRLCQLRKNYWVLFETHPQSTEINVGKKNLSLCQRKHSAAWMQTFLLASERFHGTKTRSNPLTDVHVQKLRNRMEIEIFLVVWQRLFHSRAVPSMHKIVWDVRCANVPQFTHGNIIKAYFAACRSLFADIRHISLLMEV